MVVYLYVLGAILFRILPHPWNLTPVAAMFLFSGAVFKNKLNSLLVPLAALLISDYAVDLALYHGAFHWFSPFTWGAFLLIGLLGWTLRGQWSKRLGWLKVGCASLAGSTLFFLITNFGWMWWTKVSMYPHTMSGLTACYIAGIPFYMNDLVGDLAWNAIMFGSYYWLTQRHRAGATAEAEAR
ncbi:MAG TPA: DUF6580 family putative transport protein [Terriglobia bacterium]|nr:DUF6580 family putative transport protein [Terriglobia bacterium]